ncbi:MAG: sigma-70 family RNA polymerase sigma factor, partial [Pseudomonadota bacterium]
MPGHDQIRNGRSEHSPSALSDLLERTAQRDENAFAELYRASKAQLFGVVLKILRDREQATEVLQEVYLRIWQRAVAYEEGKGAPMAWLVTVARNRALDRRRTWRAQISLEDVAEDVIGGGPGGDSGPQAQALRRCLAELKVRQRQCILLAFVEGYTHDELAQKLDSPLGTIKSLIRRGLRRLRDCLGQ